MTPLRIADATPLAFLLHQPQTTLDHPDGMLAFLLGHIQTRYEPHRVRTGGQQQNPSMPGELDQLARSLRVRKGDPSHEPPSSDGRGDELWEHRREAGEELVKVRRCGSHVVEEIGRGETGDDVVSDPGGQRLTAECRTVHAYERE